ncbi:DNA replication protein [Acinetobacter baumannii]|uniref:phage/plasmid replication protein, II/X family n=3 Tax=Acinetobacter baumannii TaxID=470 RepID=UPI000D34B80F|nr:phage/plasmid replication protein, II/X family [Acinetobacter baumannii]MBT8177352.1 phage/plasmid replication protein, II/X family [Acinetobacter baumannii]MDQ9758367.1 phage/plasmid replication protein, II/X family [Acinetobacter baumannii]PUV01588.1 DNA replication protein [Acinetobacter baumannii]
MLDKIEIRIPVDASLVEVRDDGKYCIFGFDLLDLSIRFDAMEVYKDEDGEKHHQVLRHPYSRLATSYTKMAFKFVHEGAVYPYVQIKASLAKLLQGHNVFGSDDIEQGAYEMIGFLHMTYPVLTKMLDWTRAWVSHIDVTYSAKLSDQTTAKKVLDFLANVSNGQTRLSNKRFDSSVYWGGQTSKLVNHKYYLKHDKFLSQFEELKQLAKKNDKSAQRVVDVMSDSRLINWTVGLLRFESRLKKRWLERNGVPTNLYELIAFQKTNPDLLQTLWTKATHSIFDAMRGQTVKLINDESVLEAISNSPIVVTNSGKVSQTRIRNIYATYCLIREHGLEKLAEMLPKPTFYRHLSELCECGFSKAFLHNLHDNKAKNVIPFMKLVEIDFSQQLPEWYEPPVSQFKSVA